MQQAIQIVNDLLTCGSKTTSSVNDIQIILLHVVEEIHIRIPSLYFSVRIIAGKPMKEFFNEVYEEMRNEASKMLDDTKKRIESTIQIDNDKGGTKLSTRSVIGRGRRIMNGCKHEDSGDQEGYLLLLLLSFSSSKRI